MESKFLEVCPTVYHRLTEYADVWGWEIVIYLFLGGVVAGTMILTAALELKSGERPRSTGLRLMPWLALALISLGMFALFLDLHYKRHVYRFYLALKPASPMSWGAWILLVIYPAAGLLGLGSLPEAWRERVRGWRPVRALRLTGLLDWALRVADAHRPTLLWVNIGAGIGLGIYTGLLLGTMVARIQWNSAVLGPLFLASGLSTGAAFMLLFKLDEADQKLLIRWDIVAILAELFFIGMMLIAFAGGNATAQLAGDNLLGGCYTALFWTLVVMMGLLVPLVMEVFELRRGLHMTVLAPLMILGGGIALRAILLTSGQELCFCALR